MLYLLTSLNTLYIHNDLEVHTNYMYNEIHAFHMNAVSPLPQLDEINEKI